jgi:hypothetical protein
MKTKLIMLCTFVLIAGILLTGCSDKVASAVSSSIDISTATWLALGTIKLEGTDQAVTVSQAHELLTLWQACQSISISDTTSQVELDALVEQIQGVMTSDQIKAIEAMNLTDQSLVEVLQTIGASSGVDTVTNTPDASALSQAALMAGPGFMPGGGDSIMSEISNGTVTQSTPEADMKTNQVNKMLLNGLIQLLVTRSQMNG